MDYSESHGHWQQWELSLTEMKYWNSKSFVEFMMSDHLRPPPTSSTSRFQSLTRSDWPWAARTYSPRSSQSSPFPSGSVLGSSSWDPRTSIALNSPQSGYSGTNSGRNNSTPKPLRSTMRCSGESTRQWTFTVQSSFNPIFIHSRVSFLLQGIWMGCSWCP